MILRQDAQKLFPTIPIQHVDDVLTFPVPVSLHNPADRTYNRAQEDIDTHGPGLESHVPCSVVGQFIVPACGNMYTTRECAHVVGGADTISGIVQTQSWEPQPRKGTNETRAACGCSHPRCQVDFLLQGQL